MQRCFSKSTKGICRQATRVRVGHSNHPRETLGEKQREFLSAVKRSRKLHHPFVAVHMAYWIRTDTGDLAGMICISEIVRGSFQSGYLG
jgi:hypothetical protein